MPIVVETWGEDSLKFIKEIGKKILDELNVNFASPKEIKNLKATNLE